MADAVAPADPAAVANAEAEQPRTWGSILFGILKQALMFYFISTMLGKFGGGAPKTNTTATANVKGFPPSVNLFPNGQIFDLYMYLDESELQFNNFESGNLFGQKKRLKYGDWTSGPNGDGSYVFEKTFPTPEVLLRNQSLYLHAFIVKAGQSPVPTDKNYIRREVVYGSYQLNKYKKKHYKKTANLLTGVSEQSDEDLAKAEIMKFEILNFWHPNISINIVDDHTNWQKGGVPPPLDRDLKFAPNGEFYHPILFFNNYWNLGADYMPINDTVTELKLSVTFYPLSLFKYQMYASQNMKSQWSDLLQQSDKEDDDSIKVALLETNPILLGITIVVSMLHTVLELLAFKNDIQFWKSRKDLVGLSVRSVLFNIFQSLIVFLYICDNETNFVVKMSVGMGLLIECWKIPKVMNVELDRENLLFGIIPRVKISDKGSYVESDTKVYDQMAFRYLSWVLFPLLVGYAVYSIMYVEQRGWYSWVLNMLYGYLLMFGFITMTPQLFINYKLKSVAHLPWRMLTYKFINTFIDDLFAFVIKMPTLYRIGCFRDDIIFLIYLYQRWIYRVDPSRMNEYGTSGEHEHGVPPPVEGAEGTAPTETPAIEESKKDK